MQNDFPLFPPIIIIIYHCAKFDAATPRASKGIKEAANVGQLMSVNVEPEDIAGTGAALGDGCKTTVGDVDAPMNSMAGDALEAIGGEMKIAKINVGGNAETELNDASMGTKAQKVSTRMSTSKNNGNGEVFDGLQPTNDALDCFDCPAREECTFGKTGMYKQVLLVLCCQA